MCQITENDRRTLIARLNAKLTHPPYFEGDMQEKRERLIGWQDGLEQSKTLVAYQIRPGSFTEREYHRLLQHAARMAMRPPYDSKEHWELRLEGWDMAVKRFIDILGSFWREKNWLEEQMRPWYEEVRK